MSRLWPFRTRSCGQLSRLCHAISANFHVTDHQHRFKGLYHPSTITLRQCTTIMPKAGYYAVKIGKRPGIYTTWSLFFSILISWSQFLLTFVIREDCREQVDGYPCARYKKLRTLEEAEAWMQSAVPHLVKQKIQPANRFPGEARTSIDSEPSGRAQESLSSSTVNPAASSQSRLDSGSKSQFADGLSSVRSAKAEDVVYTDGACSGNGQLGSVAGIGVWWGADDPRYVFPPIMIPSICACLSGDSNLSERCPGRQTNNRAELIVRLILHESSVSSDA
jgi:ribonuclease HI